MNCSDAQRHLELFADAEAPAEALPALEAHLAKCPSCSEQVRRWRALRGAARRALSDSTLPPGLSARIAASIAGVRRDRLRLRMGVSLGLGVAAVLLLSVMMWEFSDSGGSARKTLPPIVAAAPVAIVNARDIAYVHRYCTIDHTHDGMHVCDRPTDTVRTELCSQFKFPVLVPNLSSAGYKLAGACRCFPRRDVNVVHAFYRDAANRSLSIFSIRGNVEIEEAKPLAGAVSCSGRRQYQEAVDNDLILIRWGGADASYAVCSRIPAEELFKLVESEDFACVTPDFDDAPGALARRP